MEPIRTPFYVGIGALLGGLVLLGVWAFAGQPESPMGTFLYALFFCFALLVASAGAFLSFCTGAVFLANMLAEPRVRKKASRA